MNGWKLSAETVGIGRLLMEGNRFRVPLHQREYSWTDDEIEQMFTDVSGARATDQAEYFLGLVVFVAREGGDLTILDGQQRIVTAVIILACIRDWMRAHGYHKDADRIQEDFVGLVEYGSDQPEPKVMLNENNNGLFEEFVVNERPSEEVKGRLDKLSKYDVNRPLLDAILSCRERVDQLASGAGDDVAARADELFDLIKYLRDRVKVVRVTVPSEADAYVVFETLNYRGVDLNVLDLMKNHLFARAGKVARERDAQTRWLQMMSNLTEVQPATFVKVYWTSRHGRVQTSELFPEFKRTVSTWKDGSDTLDDMLRASEFYSGLTVADSQVWGEVTDRSRERVRALDVLSARQVHPVLLSALERFSPAELERLLRLLEVLIVRYQLIGGGRTGRLEISCASLASGIYERTIRSASEAFRAARDIYPSDNEFEAMFREKRERDGQKARYLLRSLEREASRRATGHVTTGEWDPGGMLTLEHILPKKPGAAWSEVLKKDPALAEDCTHRLGNLCLLSGVNRVLGAKSFSDKKEYFEKSSLALTKEVADWAEWNRQSIEERQERMARLARTAWTFP
jgi:hypothetical protein